MMSEKENIESIELGDIVKLKTNISPEMVVSDILGSPRNLAVCLWYDHEYIQCKGDTQERLILRSERIPLCALKIIEDQSLIKTIKIEDLSNSEIGDDAGTTWREAFETTKKDWVYLKHQYIYAFDKILELYEELKKNWMDNCKEISLRMHEKLTHGLLDIINSNIFTPRYDFKKSN